MDMHPKLQAEKIQKMAEGSMYTYLELRETFDQIKSWTDFESSFKLLQNAIHMSTTQQISLIDTATQLYHEWLVKKESQDTRVSQHLTYIDEQPIGFKDIHRAIYTPKQTIVILQTGEKGIATYKKGDSYSRDTGFWCAYSKALRSKIKASASAGGLLVPKQITKEIIDACVIHRTFSSFIKDVKKQKDPEHFEKGDIVDGNKRRFIKETIQPAVDKITDGYKKDTSVLENVYALRHPNGTYFEKHTSLDEFVFVKEITKASTFITPMHADDYANKYPTLEKLTIVEFSYPALKKTGTLIDKKHYRIRIGYFYVFSATEDRVLMCEYAESKQYETMKDAEYVLEHYVDTDKHSCTIITVPAGARECSLSLLKAAGDKISNEPNHHVNQCFKLYHNQGHYAIKDWCGGAHPDNNYAWLMRTSGTGHVYAGKVTKVKSVHNITEKEFADMCGGHPEWFELIAA